MPSFTIRVELYDADPQDYDILHEYLKLKGFSRTISDSSNDYILPAGEYNISGKRLTKRRVFNIVKLAAVKTKKKYAILVTKSAGRLWIGLEEVD